MAPRRAWRVRRYVGSISRWILLRGFSPEIDSMKESLWSLHKQACHMNPVLLLALLALGQEESVLVMTNITLSEATGAASSDAGVATQAKYQGSRQERETMNLILSKSFIFQWSCQSSFLPLIIQHVSMYL